MRSSSVKSVDRVLWLRLAVIIAITLSANVGIFEASSGRLTAAFAQNAPSSTPRVNAGPGMLAGCTIYPPDHIWNVPVDTMPLAARSNDYVTAIGRDRTMHADFGSGEWDGGPIGIPFITVPGTQKKVDVTFDYADESDAGPYPIPNNAPIEGGPNGDGDRHVLVLDRDRCMLYELSYAYPQGNGWTAGAGAIFDLNSYALRPETYTSADAAGLPILPGLVRYDEVAAGEIRHALRFTAPQTQRAYVWPARHYASSHTEVNYPPMGQRFRLKANFDITRFSRDTQVILRALKKYGMILADNGSAWYLSGAPDERWDNDILHELHNVPGSAFEAVDVSSLMISPDSGRAKIKALVANFRAAPVQGKAPLQVKFTDQSRGKIVSWLWRFGDGTSSKKQHPVHRYTKPGKYTVTLKVTGAGQKATSTKTKKGCITVK